MNSVRTRPSPPPPPFVPRPSGVRKDVVRSAGRLCAALAACLLWLAPAARAAEAPAVSGLAILQAGVFAAAAPQEAGPGHGRHRLVQAGETVPARAGTAFGVVFEVRGRPAGAPAVVEAGLVRPGGEASPVQRWFIPAVVGEKAQAVASFVYGWEAEPGPWRLTLSEGGRVLAERTFQVGDAAGPPPVTPSSVPGPSDPPSPPASSSVEPSPAVPQAPPIAPAIPVEAAPAVPEVPASAEHPAAPPVSPVPAPEPAVPEAVASPAAASPKEATAAAPDPSAKPGKAAPGPEKKSSAPEKGQEKSPDKTPAKPQEAAGGKGPMYLLQTGVFAVRDSAYAQAARYRAKGYPGCVLEEGGGKSRRYRVIVGRFPDQQRAAEARRSFVGREGGEAMVKELPAAEVARRLKCR